MSTYRDRADQRTANDFGRDQALMCQAQGCPNQWTVDLGQRTCSAHAHADPHTWPEITQAQQWDETERARRNAEPEKHYPAMNVAERRAILRRLQMVLNAAQQNPRGWIDRLQALKAGGKTLSEAQRHALAHTPGVVA